MAEYGSQSGAQERKEASRKLQVRSINETFSKLKKHPKGENQKETQNINSNRSVRYRFRLCEHGGAQRYFFSRYRGTKKGQALGAVELMG